MGIQKKQRGEIVEAQSHPESSPKNRIFRPLTTDRPYSQRNASTGSSLDALSAG